MRSSHLGSRKRYVGEKLVTVASHGFPFSTAVFHPTSNCKSIGNVVKRIPHTDIALIKLDDGIQYANETFESVVDGAAALSHLTMLEAAKNTTMGDFCYMNNPFTGYSEGTIGPVSTMRVPSDDMNVPELPWVRTQWAYMGQGFRQNLEDGVCGSAIWTQQGKVIGFFQYAPSSGYFQDWCLTVDAENLIRSGYTLAL